LRAADRYYDLGTETPLAGLVALLAEFCAVTGAPVKPMITPLGRWAAGRLPEGLPGLADPGLPAAEMIAEAARFSDLEQRDHVAWGWLAERQPAEAAREILAAAEQMPPLLRSVAVGVAQRLGPDTLPTWQDMAAAPRVGPHARAVLAAWDQGPAPSDADWQWLAVEAAAAALEDKGADEALTRVWESMPGTDLDTHLAKVRATGHPDAARLAQALGTCWEHQITLEQVMPRDPGQDYPVCVGYKGDSPVEYWSEDDPEEPEPFNLAEVNRKLAALGEAGE
jgi:hypothetical protein